MVRKKWAPYAIGIGFLVLGGCGGGGGGGDSHGDAPGGAPAELTGLAAVGAALPGARVTATCADGSGFGSEVATASDGRFTGQVEAGALPCALRVRAQNGGVTLHSLAGQAGRVNITPLTDLAIALASGERGGDWFAKASQQVAQTASKLPANTDRLIRALEGAGYSLPSQDFDPFGRAFSIGDPADRLLDALGTAVDNASGLGDHAALAALVKDGNLSALPAAPGTTGGGTGSGPIIVDDPAKNGDRDDGRLTLNEATIKAYQRPGPDVIQFAPALAGQTIQSRSLGLSTPVTIEGPTSGRIVVEGQTSSPLITVDDNDENTMVDVTIKNLTLTNVGDVAGGGIENHERLTLEQVTVQDCTATTAAGIYNHGGQLVLRNSIVRNNQADPDKTGGIDNSDQSFYDKPDRNGSLTLIDSEVTGNTGHGIANSGVLVARRSRIADNEVTKQGGGIFQGVARQGGSTKLIHTTVANNVADFGGGIAGNGQITLISSTVAGNRAEAEQPNCPGVCDSGTGGGIHAVGDLELYNSSVVNNVASREVGGIRVGTATRLESSTVAGNKAGSDPLSAGGVKIANMDPRGRATLANSIIAAPKGGTNITQSDPAFGGIQGKNVVENGLPSGPHPKILQGSPGLASLADQGGHVPVRLPGAGSIAVDAGVQAALPIDREDLDGDGSTTDALPFDSRGPAFSRIHGGGPDIGAAERGAGGAP
jgi:hypothetical protein